MIANSKLDPNLKRDTYVMGKLSDNYLLLNKNSLYPWFIIVPPTEEIEFYNLSREAQLQLLDQINEISVFIKQNFNSTKLNVACIGNVVSQLHIHIIGRHRDDACWPGVVWGNEQFNAYQTHQVQELQQKLVEQPGNNFCRL